MTDATRSLLLSALDLQPADYAKSDEETMVHLVCHRLIDQGPLLEDLARILGRYHERFGSLVEPDKQAEQADRYRRSRQAAKDVILRCEGRR